MGEGGVRTGGRGRIRRVPTRELADWWTRAGAFVLDQLILGASVLAISFVLAHVVGHTDRTTGSALFYGIAALGGALYAPLLMARTGTRNGQTLGKQAMGIRVVLADGETIGFWRGVLRTVLAQQLLAAITLYAYALVDYLWPLSDRRNQALHDKIANTLVVRAPLRESPRGEWLPPRAPGA